MKIGIVVGSLSRGGAERITIYLSSYFKKSNDEPVIITASRGKNEYECPPDIKRIDLSNGGASSLIKLIKNMRKVVEEEKLECLLIMDTPTCLYAVPGCFGTNVKTIVSERNDPSHFSGKKITKYISRLLMRTCDGYVFQTNEAKLFYNKWVNKKGVVIPNPLFAKKLPPVWKGKRENNIVSVGRLDSQKNHALLIEAFAAVSNDLPEYKLIIYGEGPLRNKLETQVRDLNLTGRVFLPGNYSDVFQKIKKASLFVFSSDFEGMPNALIEAMALGLPCISTDCPIGGPAYLINNNVNGLLVPVRDAELLSSAIKHVVSNQNLALSFSEEASKIRDILDIDVIGKKWKDYCYAVKNKGQNGTNSY